VYMEKVADWWLQMLILYMPFVLGRHVVGSKRNHCDTHAVVPRSL